MAQLGHKDQKPNSILCTHTSYHASGILKHDYPKSHKTHKCTHQQDEVAQMHKGKNLSYREHTFAIQISIVQYLSLVPISFALNRFYNYCNKRVDKVNCTCFQFHFSDPFSVEGFWISKDETSQYRLNFSIISAHEKVCGRQVLMH